MNLFVKTIFGFVALSAVTGGVVAAYLENENNQAAKRDRVPALTKSEEEWIANKGMNPRIVGNSDMKDGAIQGIFRKAERHKWTSTDKTPGTAVEIEAADGTKAVMAAHPRVSQQDVGKNKYNMDTLLEGGIDVRISGSPTIGNTLLKPALRINENKGLVGSARSAAGSKKQSGVATTLSENGNQVVYRGKIAVKKVQAPKGKGTVAKVLKKTEMRIAIGKDQTKPAVSNSRREKGYTQAGALPKPSSKTGRSS